MHNAIIKKLKIVLSPHNNNELYISTYDTSENHAELQHYRGETSFVFSGDLDDLDLYAQAMSKAIVGNSNANYESCELTIEDQGVCPHLFAKVINAFIPVDALIVDKNQKTEEILPPVFSESQSLSHEDFLDFDNKTFHDNPYMPEYYDRFD